MTDTTKAALSPEAEGMLVALKAIQMHATSLSPCGVWEMALAAIEPIDPDYAAAWKARPPGEPTAEAKLMGAAGALRDALLAALPVLMAAQWSKPEWFAAARQAVAALGQAGMTMPVISEAGAREAPSDKALAACLALCEAYQHGEDNDSSMDWSDVDAAWALAKAAVAQAEADAIDARADGTAPPQVEAQALQAENARLRDLVGRLVEPADHAANDFAYLADDAEGDNDGKEAAADYRERAATAAAVVDEARALLSQPEAR